MARLRGRATAIVASEPMAISMLPVAGDDHDAPLRLGLREAEADQRGAAHGAPEVEVVVAVAGRVDVVARRAEPGDHQRLVARRQQRRHRRAAVQSSEPKSRRSCAHHFFAPRSRCPIRTAIC